MELAARLTLLEFAIGACLLPLVGLSQNAFLTDFALRHAISQAVGKPPAFLSVRDMESLEHLDASGLGVKSILGLEAAKNLITLDLSNNPLSGISIPAELTNLQHLDLSRTQLRDLTLPNGLLNLRTLALSGNGVSTLRIPFDMAQLASLAVDGNPLTRLEFSDEFDLGNLSIKGFDVGRITRETTVLEGENTHEIFPPSSTPQIQLGKLSLSYDPATSTAKVGVTANDERLYLIEARSLDSKEWSQLSPPGTATNLRAILDMESSNQAARFYRLLEGPKITSEPTSVVVSSGDAVTLNVIATGTGPLTYEWNYQGTRAQLGSITTLEIPKATDSDEGIYTVKVSNRVGEVESRSVTLSVLSPLSINSQPSAQTIIEGGSFILSVAATGEGRLSYQWFKNGSEIPRATSPTLIGTNATIADSGNYWVAVSDTKSKIESNSVPLVVNEHQFAPTNLNGYTVRASINNGTGPIFASSGNLRFMFHYRDSRFAVLPMSGLVETLTTGYSYQSKSGRTATLEYTDSGGNRTLATLTFSSETKGNYQAIHPGRNDVQNGTFVVEGRSSGGQNFAPISIGSKRVRLGINNGSGLFAQLGGYVFATSGSGSTYTIRPTAGLVIPSNGDYEYRRLSGTVATVTAVDEVLFAIITTELTFFNEFGGTFDNRALGVGGSQSGAFTFE